MWRWQLGPPPSDWEIEVVCSVSKYRCTDNCRPSNLSDWNRCLSTWPEPSWRWRRTRRARPRRTSLGRSFPFDWWARPRPTFSWTVLRTGRGLPHARKPSGRTSVERGPLRTLILLTSSPTVTEERACCRVAVLRFLKESSRSAVFMAEAASGGLWRRSRVTRRKYSHFAAKLLAVWMKFLVNQSDVPWRWVSLSWARAEFITDYPSLLKLLIWLLKWFACICARAEFGHIPKDYFFMYIYKVN